MYWLWKLWWWGWGGVGSGGRYRDALGLGEVGPQHLTEGLAVPHLLGLGLGGNRLLLGQEPTFVHVAGRISWQIQIFIISSISGLAPEAQDS